MSEDKGRNPIREFAEWADATFPGARQRAERLIRDQQAQEQRQRELELTQEPVPKSEWPFNSGQRAENGQMELNQANLAAVCAQVQAEGRGAALGAGYGLQSRQMPDHTAADAYVRQRAMNNLHGNAQRESISAQEYQKGLQGLSGYATASGFMMSRVCRSVTMSCMSQTEAGPFSDLVIPKDASLEDLVGLWYKVWRNYYPTPSGHVKMFLNQLMATYEDRGGDIKDLHEPYPGELA